VPRGEVPELLMLPLLLWLYGGSSIDKPILFIGIGSVVIDEESSAKKEETKKNWCGLPAARVSDSG